MIYFFYESRLGSCIKLELELIYFFIYFFLPIELNFSKLNSVRLHLDYTCSDYPLTSKQLSTLVILHSEFFFYIYTICFSIYQLGHVSTSMSTAKNTANFQIQILHIGCPCSHSCIPKPPNIPLRGTHMR